ncbi:sodium-dependent phosphate transport protein 2B-like [Glandiceps talaboti]
MDNKAYSTDKENGHVTHVSIGVGTNDDDVHVDGSKGNSSYPPPAYDSNDSKLENGVSGGSPAYTTDEKNEDKEIDDPWALPNVKPTGKPWKELSCPEKCWRVIRDGIIKMALLLGLLYLFICSLDFLSSAFRLLGGKAAGEAIGSSVVATNPICGLMVGVLATVLVQSSSTSTSVVVSMVASGILEVRPAIPIVMGANIGTSVTNTIVSLFQASDRNEFRRAFAGATVHDMFNWLSVFVLLPLELVSGYLYLLTDAIVKSLHLQTNEGASVELLKVITKPFTELVIQVDKKVITKVAEGKADALKTSLMKQWCVKDKVDVYTMQNVTELQNSTDGSGFINVTTLRNISEEVTVNIDKCYYLFFDLKYKYNMKDSIIGIIVLISSLAILCICLVLIVKILHSLLKGQIAVITKKVINSNFPGRLAWLTGYVAILVGAGLTILVQSSSIFTSAMTPLVGIGVVSVDRMYPFTLGANIGTTVTAILAALASSGGKLALALQIALCHFFFNISGIVIWYPIPQLRKVPIAMAKINGNTTAKYRWFAILYLIVIFLILPAAIFGLSLAGWVVLAAVGIPFLVFLTVVIVINVLQRKRPGALPRKLRNWNFLPLALHSLEPLDRVLTAMVRWKICKNCCSQCKPLSDERVVVEANGTDLNTDSHIMKDEKNNLNGITENTQL